MYRTYRIRSQREGSAIIVIIIESTAGRFKCASRTRGAWAVAELQAVQNSTHLSVYG